MPSANRAQPGCTSPSMSERYLEIVFDLCDKVMYSIGSNWRDRFYAAYLDNVMAISIERNKQLHSRYNLSYQGNRIHRTLALGNQSWRPYESPGSMSSTSNFTTPNSSPLDGYAFSFSGTPLSASSGSSNHQFSPERLPFHTASPVELPSSAFQERLTPVELPSPDPCESSPLRELLTYSTTAELPAAEKFLSPSSGEIPIAAFTVKEGSPSTKTKSLRCELCNLGFTGKSGDQKTNYKRHMRSAHHDGKPIPCPECNEEFRRSDYLRRHRVKKHGWEITPVHRRKKKGLELRKDVPTGK